MQQLRNRPLIYLQQSLIEQHGTRLVLGRKRNALGCGIGQEDRETGVNYCVQRVEYPFAGFTSYQNCAGAGHIPFVRQNFTGISVSCPAVILENVAVGNDNAGAQTQIFRQGTCTNAENNPAP